MSQLFNEVHHIYNYINMAKSHEQHIIRNNVPHNMKDVLDKVMDYEPSGIVPDMNNHMFEYNQPEVDDTGEGGGMRARKISLLVMPAGEESGDGSEGTSLNMMAIFGVGVFFWSQEEEFCSQK
jgi:hypothetical protein